MVEEKQHAEQFIVCKLYVGFNVFFISEKHFLVICSVKID